MTNAEKYRVVIEGLPPPGGGGAHQAIYGAGCAGYRARLPVEQVVADVQRNLPRGTREVSNEEVEQGVRQAYSDLAGDKPPAARPPPRVAPDALDRLVANGKGATVEAIEKRSVIPLDWPAWEAAWRVLEALYGENEIVFIGDDAVAGRLGETVRRRGDWVNLLKALGRCPWPKLMLNPLTGAPAPKKAGTGTSLRGDGAVAAFRYVLVEHDTLPIDDQLAFWMAAPLPVVVLTLSGKKSVHGIVRVDCPDAAAWRRDVEETLFAQYLAPMGFDRACKNASRLSRLPGHVRADTGRMQTCFYLAPKGKAVAA